MFITRSVTRSSQAKSLHWLPDSLVSIDYVEMLWALFERFSGEILDAIETIEIIQVFVEMGPNEVCDRRDVD